MQCQQCTNTVTFTGNVGNINESKNFLLSVVLHQDLSISDDTVNIYAIYDILVIYQYQAIISANQYICLALEMCGVTNLLLVHGLTLANYKQQVGV